jgi:hypothetical protein
MSSILRITVNSRKRLFQRDVKIGVRHEFKSTQTQEGCNCPITIKPEEYLVTTVKLKDC